MCLAGAALGGAPGYRPQGASRWPASLESFLRGDADSNSSVDFNDVTAVLEQWNSAQSTNTSRTGSAGILALAAHHFGDATGDGLVNSTDLKAVVDGYSAPRAAPQTPEGPGPALERGTSGGELAPRAIARWDAVPNEVIRGDSTLGVVAFHLAGIRRVDFYLNGHFYDSARELTRNPRTGVVEYTVALRGDELPAGVLEFVAVAVPDWGEPRTLEPLRVVNRTGTDPAPALFVRTPAPAPEEESPDDNTSRDEEDGGDERGATRDPADGSLERPFERIYDAAVAAVKAGAETIYLLPGDHLWAGREPGENSVRLADDFGWLTIAGAPGTEPGEVRIVGNSSSNGGLNSQRVRFQGLSLVGVTLDANRSWQAAAWFDGCLLSGAGRGDRSTGFVGDTTWTGGTYATGCTVSDVTTATKHWDLVRGCRFERIGSDVFHNPLLVLDCEVNDVRKDTGSTAHPDLVQFNGDFENVIVYGLRATEVWAQGIFSRGSNGVPDRDLAFVNIEIDARSHLSQWLQSADHLLFWNVSFKGRSWKLANDPKGTTTELTNLSVRDCAVDSLLLDPEIRTGGAQVWLGNEVGAMREPSEREVSEGLEEGDDTGAE